MTTVKIDLNCMCLFVPERRLGTDVGTVHVLMPATHHCHGAERHLVRMMFQAPDGSEQTREMEGWELVLGAAPGTATLSLVPPGDPDGTVVDITTVTADAGSGYRVPRRLLDEDDRSIAARIVLNAGRVADLDAQEGQWEMNGKRYILAHRLTWQMELPTPELSWRNLLEQPRTRTPLPSLTEVAPEVIDNEVVYRLHVHHITEKAFNDAREAGTAMGDAPIKFDPRVLSDQEIKDHFRMFYALMGDPAPESRLLPQWVPDSGGGGGGWACKLALAQPA